MRDKPVSCMGCPMYGDGRGFVPDQVIDGAPVWVIMQNPGAQEEASGIPAVGATGQMMDTHFIPLAGLERGKSVSVGNILKCRNTDQNGRKTNELPKGGVLDEAIIHCTSKYLSIPPTVKLVIAQGALAFKWATQSKIGKMTDWRGFLLPGGIDVAE